MSLRGAITRRPAKTQTWWTCLLALAALALLPLSASPVHALPGVVQSGSAACGPPGPCSTVSIMTGSAITTGNVLVVSVQSFFDGSVACVIAGISDTSSNPLPLQIGVASQDSPLNQCVWSQINTATITTGGVADKITAKLAVPATWIGIQYQEVSGVSATGAAVVSSDHKASSSSTGSPAVDCTLVSYSLPSASFTLGSFLVGSYSTDYIDGLLGYQAPTTLPTFTIQTTDPPFEAFDEYSTTPSASSTWPASNAGGVCAWAGVGVALAPLVSPSVPQFPLGLPLLLGVATSALILLRSRGFGPARTAD
jgi:hypothetical protein